MFSPSIKCETCGNTILNIALQTNVNEFVHVVCPIAEKQHPVDFRFVLAAFIAFPSEHLQEILHKAFSK